MRPVNYVAQRSNWDCGVACLAMVSGETYERVIEICGEKVSRFDWHEKGMPTADLPFLLAEMGLATLRKYGRHPDGWLDSSGLRIGALTLPTGLGHYVVRLPDGTVYDPSTGIGTEYPRHAAPFHVWQVVEVSQ
jgi:ABC-type bacteriocin/lantibiotic exporter with double-glycine peptidase domain